MPNSSYKMGSDQVLPDPVRRWKAGLTVQSLFPNYGLGAEFGYTLYSRRAVAGSALGAFFFLRVFERAQGEGFGAGSWLCCEFDEMGR